MKRLLAYFAVLSIGTVLAGCAYPIRNDAIVETRSPAYEWKSLAPGELQDTLVIVTMSGGGTRATALAMSVLRAMDKIKLASGASLADEIDIVSSVSGGSVTAGYFALYGTAGLPTLEKDFVRQDGMRAIIVEGLNPIGLAQLATPSKERIDLLVNYLDRQLFHDVTFEKLVERKRRPYLILNAADMVEGTPFPFTQYTMDLLCSDLTKVKLSTAVAASAAFPVALSPITLKNYRPCEMIAKPVWLRAAGQTSWYLDPPRVAWQRTASAYADGQKKYIHLLDGGIADNLGVSEPYRLLTSDDVPVSLKQDIAAGKIKKIVFIMINARSFAGSDLDNSQATPGMLDMLTASIGSSIDRATFSTSERIRNLLIERFRGMADDIDRESQEARTDARQAARDRRQLQDRRQQYAVPRRRFRRHRRSALPQDVSQHRDELGAAGQSDRRPERDGRGPAGAESRLSQGPAGGQCAARPALRDGRAGLRRSPARRVIADRAARAISP